MIAAGARPSCHLKFLECWKIGEVQMDILVLVVPQRES